jgi:hypothetical protein
MTSGIIEILLENSGVTNLVGSVGGHVKIFPTQAPQTVLLTYGDYITVSEVSLNPSLAKGCPPDMDRPRYVVLCFSLDFRKAEILQAACRAALDTGQGFTTDAGATFDQIWMVDRSDLFQPAQGDGAGMYVKSGIYECVTR